MSNKVNLIPRTHPGRLFVLSGPAGSGKTTLVDRLREDFSHVLKNVSYTTRPKREGEVEGRDYHFVTPLEFDEMERRGDFLETQELFGNRYGTSRLAIESSLEQGFHLILVIDVEGAMKIRALKNAPLIFVVPPSLQVLEERLSARNSEKEPQMKKRLERAVLEVEQAKVYDYIFINDHLDQAYEIFKCILVAAMHEVRRS